MPKYKGNDTERLTIAVLTDLGYEGWRQEASAGLVRFQKGGKYRFFQRSRDIYGCVDVIGKAGEAVCPLNAFLEPEKTIAGGPMPVEWYIQLTTGEGKTKRKRNLEQSQWHAVLLRLGIVRVSVMTHESVPDPKDFRKKQHFLRVDDMLLDEPYEGSNMKFRWEVRGVIDTDHLQRGRVQSRAKMAKFLTKAATKPYGA